MGKFIGGKKGSSVDLGKNIPDGIYNLDSQYQGTRLGGWDGGIVATGGIISDYQEPSGEIYRAHIFTAPGTFTVTSTGKVGDTTYPSTVDVFVQGSGGGGSGAINSYWAGAGGGAGGQVEVRQYPVSTSPGSYPISIGNGGGASSRAASNSVQAQGGNDTTFTNPSGPLTITAKGGGGGGGSGPAVSFNNQRGNTGGCSGGSGASGNSSTSGAKSSATPGYATQIDQNSSYPAPVNLSQFGGFGGWGDVTYTGEGSGGGGCGGKGEDVDSPLGATQNKDGGAGRRNSWATGTATVYGQGGDAGPQNNSPDQSGAIMHGEECTGNGGNGGAYPPGAEPGSAGCRGIVVVRYRIGQSRTSAHLSGKATGGAIQYVGPQTVHVFYTPGTFENTSGSALNCNFLMVGGGGGAGCDNGGGGGGGEVVIGQNYPVPDAAYPIVVGKGGRGSRALSPGPADAGYNGEATTFNSLTARGGSNGGGAGTVAQTGQSSMGNGGGGAGVVDNPGVLAGGAAPAPAANTPTVTYHGGYDGGHGSSHPGGGGAPEYNAGGGAGAAANGVDGDGPSPTMSNGGAGYQEPAPTAILGTPYYWGGGGAGGSYHAPPVSVAVMTGGAGGGGGGVGNGPTGSHAGTAGAGGLFTASTASNSNGGGCGANGTGGGGGGDGRDEVSGGAGGGGIFIISYPT
tara:strand:+ start:67 stop:2109 length:2043 start_codon:yes stop_codon:yes gene_type:complete